MALRLAERLGIAVRKEPFAVGELYGADEAIITGTTVEVTSVVEVDGRSVGDGRPGPVTRKLQEAFDELIRQL